jgi:phage-related protein
MPHVEDALQSVKEAMTTISLSDTWEVALSRIKWVMDTVSPVAEVRYDILSLILG